MYVDLKYLERLSRNHEAHLSSIKFLINYPRLIKSFLHMTMCLYLRVEHGVTVAVLSIRDQQPVAIRGRSSDLPETDHLEKETSFNPESNSVNKITLITNAAEFLVINYNICTGVSVSVLVSLSRPGYPHS